MNRIWLLLEIAVILSVYIGIDVQQILRRQKDVANGNGKTNGFEYGSTIALGLFVVTVLIIIGTAAWWAFTKTPPGYSSGSAAATVLFLVVIALIIARPALIMDDAPDAGGEPSTMRVLSLVLILTFCAIMLRNGWNDGELPSLENQSNWVWLVTAALGGKALQKYAEVQQKKEEIKAKATEKGS